MMSDDVLAKARAEWGDASQFRRIEPEAWAFLFAVPLMDALEAAEKRCKELELDLQAQSERCQFCYAERLISQRESELKDASLARESALVEVLRFLHPLENEGGACACMSNSGDKCIIGQALSDPVSAGSAFRERVRAEAFEEAAKVFDEMAESYVAEAATWTEDEDARQSCLATAEQERANASHIRTLASQTRRNA